MDATVQSRVNNESMVQSHYKRVCVALSLVHRPVESKYKEKRMHTHVCMCPVTEPSASGVGRVGSEAMPPTPPQPSHETKLTCNQPCWSVSQILATPLTDSCSIRIGQIVCSRSSLNLLELVGRSGVSGCVRACMSPSCGVLVYCAPRVHVLAA